MFVAGLLTLSKATGTALDVTSGDVSVAGAATVGSILTVTGDAMFRRHLLYDQLSPLPSITAQSFAQSITASVVTNSTDTAGAIDITPNLVLAGLTSGDSVTIQFGSAFASAPFVFLTPGGGTGTASQWASMKPAVASLSNTGFQINFVGTGSLISLGTTVLQVFWYVAGTF